MRGTLEKLSGWQPSGELTEERRRREEALVQLEEARSLFEELTVKPADVQHRIDYTSKFIIPTKRGVNEAEIKLLRRYPQPKHLCK